MGVFDAPKALYKAQQAKNQMKKVEAASKEGAVAVLLNGLNEITEVEMDIEELGSYTNDKLSEMELNQLANKLSKDVKKAVASAKKELEKELVKNTNIEDLKGLLG